MAPPPSPPTSSPHPHSPGETCSHCGATLPIERSYDVKDRFARSLRVAICRAERVEPHTRSKRPNAPIYITAKDTATLDRISKRFEALVPVLDDELLGVFRAFIKKHCGIDAPPASR